MTELDLVKTSHEFRDIFHTTLGRKDECDVI